MELSLENLDVPCPVLPDPDVRGADEALLADMATTCALLKVLIYVLWICTLREDEIGDPF